MIDWFTYHSTKYISERSPPPIMYHATTETKCNTTKADMHQQNKTCYDKINCKKTKTKFGHLVQCSAKKWTGPICSDRRPAW